MDDFDSALIIDEITGADDTPLSEAFPQLEMQEMVPYVINHNIYDNFLPIFRKTLIDIM